MIRKEFLFLLVLLIGRDGSDAEISAATIAFEKLMPDQIEVLGEAKEWTPEEQDLMTLHAVFYLEHNRAPSWNEYRECLRHHLADNGQLMLPGQRTTFERLLSRDFQQLRRAILAATSPVEMDAKVAEFHRVKPIKTTDSTKPATPEKAKQVQRITQETPKQPKPVEPEIPKAVQQQKLHKPEKPEPIQPVEPELTRPFHQIKPEILPNTRG